MTSTPRYFFKKQDRLKSRKAIDLLFQKGKSFSVYPFKVIWLPVCNDHHLQAGVAVSSRNFKKAVDRNRIKRLMREAYRLQKAALADRLFTKERRLSLFIIYTGKELPEYNLVVEKISSIIGRLIKLTDEVDQNHT